MTRDAELPARDYLSLVLSGVGKESDIGVVQSLHRQVKPPSTCTPTRPPARAC
ncbi:hypothetical protein STENM223S_07664 [Streptomyces tendae]